MKRTNKKSKKSGKGAQTWNLKLFYSSPSDPQIEKDVTLAEEKWGAFAQKYDVKKKLYLTDASALLEMLTEYEDLLTKTMWKPLMYFYFTRDLDSKNKTAVSQIPLLENRGAHLNNKTIFFEVSLGEITLKKQKEFLATPKLTHFKVFLQRIFSDASHLLSVPEEKILTLKAMPAHNMWTTGNQKLLNSKSVTWKGKSLPIPQAANLISDLQKASDRKKLSDIINTELKTVAPLSEAELNAIFTNKKIDDELRGYKTPYEATVQGYRNDPKVVEALVKTVSEHFSLAHKFFIIKAKLLKQGKLSYADRNAHVGKIGAKFNFDQSVEVLTDEFGKLGSWYSETFQKFVQNGQIDAFSRIGKKGGAYCWGSSVTPTMVLLNHAGDLDSLSTFAHEMGHAFHTELSKKQGALYDDYSISLAETASTLFEAIVTESVLSKLPEKEQIIVLHNKVLDSIQTVFRQIACFNFELDLHHSIRAKGFLGHEEIAGMHNKHMQNYLGPIFKLMEDDGYFFVQWGHIRRFFYVYSYAYGMLVSKAMLRRYKKDPSFWKSIEKFLSAGGSDSPENILKSIGIDITTPTFWKEGLKEIEDDIKKLENLAKKRL